LIKENNEKINMFVNKYRIYKTHLHRSACPEGTAPRSGALWAGGAVHKVLREAVRLLCVRTAPLRGAVRAGVGPYDTINLIEVQSSAPFCHSNTKP
jgi:hypothetical protein